MTIEQANREYAPLLRGIILERELGRSSYAVVYAAADTDGAACRIKIISLPGSETGLSALREGGLDDAAIRARLETAMRGIVAQTDRLRRLDVPTILAVEDRRLVEGRSGELLLLVRYEPLTLFDDFAPSHDITANDALNLGIAVCGALEAAVEVGVLHGNLKPSNLFVAPDGTVCVGDFAEERLLGQALDSVTFDSLLYMAPELQSGAAMSAGTDLYALGILLYSLFNNRCIPFLGRPDAGDADIRRAIFQRGEDDVPPPANADEEICTMLVRACARDPRRRYGSAAEFADDLRDCLLDEKEDYVILPATDTIYEILPLRSGEPETPKPAAGSTGPEEDELLPPPAAPTQPQIPYAGAYMPPYGNSAYAATGAAIRAAQQIPGDSAGNFSGSTYHVPPAQTPPPQAARPFSEARSVAAASPALSRTAQTPPASPEPDTALDEADDYYTSTDENEGTKRLILVLAAILILLILFGGIVWGINKIGSLGQPEDTGKTPGISTPGESDTAAPDTSAPDTAAPDTSAPDTTAPDTAAPDTAASDTTAPQTPIINDTTAAPPKQVAMPLVVGQSYTEAAAALKALGISSRKTEAYSDTVAEGVVIAQSAGEGASIPEGSIIALTVSLGREKVQVPSLVGLGQAEAEKRLADLGLTADISTKYDSSAAGTVLSQSPATGERLIPGSAVQLTVSAGLKTLEVPNFVGMTQAAAEALVRQSGFTAVEWQTAPSASYAKDIVCNQSIAAGSTIRPSDALTLCVSLGGDTLTVPDVRGMTADAASAILHGCGYTPVIVYEKSNASGVIATSPAAGATLAAGERVTLSVATSDASALKLSLPLGDLSLTFAQTVTLQVEGVQGRTLSFTSSDSQVASVDSDGRITANAVGQALITVTAGSETAKCYINVSADNAAFTTTVSGGGCIVTGYRGSDSAVVVPDRINGMPVTGIGDSAFAGKTVTSVYLPSTVTTIGDSAFEGCAHLTTVTLPAGLTSIGDSAFASCTVLRSISLPAGLTSLGDSAFARCYSLETVCLPASLTAIGDRVFRYCSSLTVFVPANSAALDFAHANGLSFTLFG